MVHGLRVASVSDEYDTAALSQWVESRAVIEQAKGMLGVIYDIDDDVAFAVLRWRSQTTNTKLKVLAAQLLVDFRSVNGHPALPPRSTYDHLLLTAHERVGRSERPNGEAPLVARCWTTKG